MFLVELGSNSNSELLFEEKADSFRWNKFLNYSQVSDHWLICLVFSFIIISWSYTDILKFLHEPNTKDYLDIMKLVRKIFRNYYESITPTIPNIWSKLTYYYRPSLDQLQCIHFCFNHFYKIRWTSAKKKKKNNLNFSQLYTSCNW